MQRERERDRSESICPSA
uniref:Uncharacterized protein n=1 Tax=Anguilla anguilla TaxID=7936 RepID=A0A0E9TFG9_ANGAN